MQHADEMCALPTAQFYALLCTVFGLPRLLSHGHNAIIASRLYIYIACVNQCDTIYLVCLCSNAIKSLADITTGIKDVMQNCS